MKALTVRQPWASLIALGVKTIETRSWSTRYRGPLAVHAGKARPDLCWEGGGYAIAADDDGRFMYRGHLGARSSLPLGAVVAVVDLIDVVPIIDGSLGWTEDSDTPPAAVVVSWDSAAMLVDTRETGPFPDVTDQLPFGVFAPGRFAWLLGDVRPLVPPVPAKGRQGLWTWEAQP